MLPKKFRLTVAQFNFLHQKSTTYASDYLIIKTKEEKKGKYTETNSSATPKFVIIVPKAVDKRSSARHLAKRVVGEAILKQIKNLKKPVKILVKVKKIIRKTDRQNIYKELNLLFDKAKLI